MSYIQQDKAPNRGVTEAEVNALIAAKLKPIIKQIEEIISTSVDSPTREFYTNMKNSLGVYESN